MTAIELLKPHRHAGRDYLAGVATTHPVAVAERHRHWRFFVVTSSTGFAATRELELDGWL